MFSSYAVRRFKARNLSTNNPIISAIGQDLVCIITIVVIMLTIIQFPLILASLK